MVQDKEDLGDSAVDLQSDQDKITIHYLPKPKETSSRDELETLYKEKGDDTPQVLPEDNNAPLLWTRKRKVTFGCLIVADLIMGCVFTILEPFLPVVADQYGLGSLAVGFIFGSFDLAVVLSSVIWGKLIGKIAAKKIFAAGVICYGLGNILFGLSYYCSSGRAFLVTCIIGRFLIGIAASAYLTASMAIIASTFYDILNRTQGICETMAGIGYIIGPFLGGALFQAIGYQWTFAIGGLMAVVMGVVCIYGISPIKNKPLLKTESSSTNKSPLLTILKSPDGLLIIIIYILTGSANSFFDATLVLHLEQFKLLPIIIGTIMAVMSVSYAIGSPIWGFVADKYTSSSSYILVGGVMVAGLAFNLVGPAPFLFIRGKQFWLTMAMLVLIDACLSVNVVIFGLILALAEKLGLPKNSKTEGVASGILNSAYYMGGFLGPIIGGVLYDQWKFEWAATAIGVTLISSAVVFMTRRLSLKYCCKKN